ncbi:MAG TPA: hypothetical protein VMV75_05215, partial [Sulfuricella sp.]|nr:hypothetical protein [Sulfuricella sp.]
FSSMARFCGNFEPSIFCLSGAIILTFCDMETCVLAGSGEDGLFQDFCRADRSLYETKRVGRNRLVLAQG